LSRQIRLSDAPKIEKRRACPAFLFKRFRGGRGAPYLLNPAVDQRLSNEFDCACAGALALPPSGAEVGASAICCGLLSAATCCGFGFAA
jgi:hypothetical protein